MNGVLNDHHISYDMVIKFSRRLFKYNSCVKDNHALYAIYAKALYKKGKKKHSFNEILKCICDVSGSRRDYQ